MASVPADKVWVTIGHVDTKSYNHLVLREYATGANAILFGFLPYDPANPTFVSSKRNKINKVLLQDQTTTQRKITLPIGAQNAPIGVSGTTVQWFAKGSATAVTMTSLGIIPGRSPKAGNVPAKPVYP